MRCAFNLVGMPREIFISRMEASSGQVDGLGRTHAEGGGGRQLLDCLELETSYSSVGELFFLRSFDGCRREIFLLVVFKDQSRHAWSNEELWGYGPSSWPEIASRDMQSGLCQPRSMSLTCLLLVSRQHSFAHHCAPFSSASTIVTHKRPRRPRGYARLVQSIDPAFGPSRKRNRSGMERGRVLFYHYRANAVLKLESGFKALVLFSGSVAAPFLGVWVCMSESVLVLAPTADGQVHLPGQEIRKGMRLIVTISECKGGSM